MLSPLHFSEDHRMSPMKVKDVLAALAGLDPEAECCLEFLPTPAERAQGLGGAFGASFTISPQASQDGGISPVFFCEREEAATPWPR